jgi:hypothetical protein
VDGSFALDGLDAVQIDLASAAYLGEKALRQHLPGNGNPLILIVGFPGEGRRNAR